MFELDFLSQPQKALETLKLKDEKAILISAVKGSDGLFHGSINQEAEHPYLKRYAWSSRVMVSEIFRQMSVGVVREFYEVPPENDYALTNFSIEYHSHPDDIPEQVDCRVEDRAFTGSGDEKARFAIEIKAASHLICRVGLEGPIYPVAVYKKIREEQRKTSTTGTQPAEQVAPEVVLKSSADEVLVSKPEGNDGNGWQMMFTGAKIHPCFHHNVDVPDHIPGAMLIEAADQAVLAVKGQPLTLKSVAGDLFRFLELDAQTWISVKKIDNQDLAWRVEFSQNNKIGGCLTLTEHRLDQEPG